MVDPVPAGPNDDQPALQEGRDAIVQQKQDDPWTPRPTGAAPHIACNTPIIVRQLWRIMRAQKLTDAVQALSAIGLLILGLFGYFYTVQPAFRRDLLQEQVDQLTKTVNKYNDTSRPYVIRQFLGKVLSDAARYTCGPTVWDLRADNLPPPPPKNGAKLIEINLANEEFQLLDSDRRVLLTAAIEDFVKHRYADPQGFSLELETQHSAHFSGPLSAFPRSPNLFRFSQDESQKSEKAFQSFNRAMTALRADLLPDETSPAAAVRSCIDLGANP